MPRHRVIRPVGQPLSRHLSGMQAAITSFVRCAGRYHVICSVGWVATTSFDWRALPLPGYSFGKSRLSPRNSSGGSARYDVIRPVDREVATITK